MKKIEKRLDLIVERLSKYWFAFILTPIVLGLTYLTATLFNPSGFWWDLMEGMALTLIFWSLTIFYLITNLNKNNRITTPKYKLLEFLKNKFKFIAQILRSISAVIGIIYLIVLFFFVLIAPYTIFNYSFSN